MQKLDLKRIRKEQKLTQVKLSEITGYPQGFISQMENGNESIPNAFITILADKLHIANIDEYFVDKDKELVKNDTEEETRKITNLSIRKNAKWQNDSSYSIIQRLLTMIERKEEKIDNLEAEIREMRAKIIELKTSALID